MAARPKERKLKETLLKLAIQDMGEEATGLDWVVSQIESGVTVTALAEILATELGESCSRGWISSVINRLTVDAKERITEARREAAGGLIDSALSITDEAVTSTADVQRNRMRADTRMRIAGWWDRETYGDKAAVSVSIDLPALHLAALRLRTVDQGLPTHSDGKVIPSATPALLGAGNVPDEPDVEIVA